MRTKTRTSDFTRRLKFAVVAPLIGAGLFLGACGGSYSAVSETKDLYEEGKTFEVGPLRYNVLFSRQLNKFDVEDRAYLAGKPAPAPGKTYLGVFIKVRNTDEDSPHRLPDSFEIVDTDGKRFENLDSESIFALQTGAKVAPDKTLPAPNSTAATGPIQAALLVYLVEDEVLELRPIDLEVPGDGKTVKVELDL